MTSPISCQGQLARAAVQWYQCPVHYPWEPSPHTQRAPWELFNGCTVLENQTRQRWSDHRRILLSKRDRTLKHGAGACTHLWYLLENNETSPQWGFFQRSVKHTNTIYQVCTNTIYQVRLYKFKYNTKSVWKQSLCMRCIVAECPYSPKNEYYQMMKSVKWFEQSRNIWIRQPTFCDICLKLMYLPKNYNNWLA